MRTMMPAPGRAFSPAPHRHAGRSARALAAAAALVVCGCSQTREDRRHTLARAGDADQTVASSAVVQDLRAPTDSPRIIYTRPTNLAMPAVTAGGAPATSSTHGVSVPDTARARPGAAQQARPGAPAPA